MTRIAIVDKNKCKPEKCQKECMKTCPPQRNGKNVIEIVYIEDMGKNINNPLIKTNDKHKIAKIIESMCIGCNQCVSACPFNAIKIVNIPKENPRDIIHRYGENGFRLYRLPTMKKNCVMSLIGQNGIGKSTILDIISNALTPNFEQTNMNIKTQFKGTVMMNYFNDLYANRLVFSVKPQKIKQMLQGYNPTTTVEEYIHSCKISADNNPTFIELNLASLYKNPIASLSGGELQRLLCWVTVTKPATVYIFDEPSNFLDVKQRLIVAKMIRSLVSVHTYVLIVDHDMSMLDFISDEINILYGVPGAYGIVSNPLSASNGINEYLDGFLSSQNIRFRDEPFQLAPSHMTISTNTVPLNTVPLVQSETLMTHTVCYPGFVLHIPLANLTLNSSLYLILGENGVGKTTFLNTIASSMNKIVSYKTQHTNIRKYMHIGGMYPTVLELFYSFIRLSYLEPTFQTNIVKILNIKSLESRRLNELSGGELQRVMLCFTLGTSADIYLLDEPSSNLDIESRLACIHAIKRFSYMNSFSTDNLKSIFIIEHDIMMAVAWAQEPNSSILLVSKDINLKDDIKDKLCHVSNPMNFKDGINAFLQSMEISMRISEHNSRPRINKLNSQMDKHQKNIGNYYGNTY